MKKPLINEWIQKAEADLIACRRLSKQESPTQRLADVADIVCFHAQQCAEKYLKAYLNSKGQEAPKIHSLKILVDLCRQIDEEFQTLLLDAGQLEEYAIEFRYPGESATEEEARDALRKAVSLREFLRMKLDKE